MCECALSVFGWWGWWYICSPCWIAETKKNWTCLRARCCTTTFIGSRSNPRSNHSTLETRNSFSIRKKSNFLNLPEKCAFDFHNSRITCYWITVSITSTAFFFFVSVFFSIKDIPVFAHRLAMRSARTTSEKKTRNWAQRQCLSLSLLFI